jgi:indole-3-glycerol phosphate synthase
MNAVLNEIVERTRADLAVRRGNRPLIDVEKAAATADRPRPFAEALRRGGGVGVIAELKAQSPSAGLLRSNYDVAAGAAAYARAGARALSILTEPHFFGGRPADLATARAACALPVLRKDFVIDPYQVVEARAHGADAVLLIVRLLDDRALVSLLGEARRWGMEALVEAHTAEEVQRALRAGASLLGLNSRDLDTLQMDPGAFARLSRGIPADRTVVAESGVKTPEDVRALKALGIHAVLIGESFLRQPDLETAARPLVEAGKSGT